MDTWIQKSKKNIFAALISDFEIILAQRMNYARIQNNDTEYQRSKLFKLESQIAILKTIAPRTEEHRMVGLLLKVSETGQCECVKRVKRLTSAFWQGVLISLIKENFPLAYSVSLYLLKKFLFYNFI